jgi:hypothetical protein
MWERMSCEREKGVGEEGLLKKKSTGVEQKSEEENSREGRV